VAREQPIQRSDAEYPNASLHRYYARCCDFDGTIAHDGAVGEPMVQALQRVAASGRRLVLATGRELDDLRRAFPELSVEDTITDPGDSRRAIRAAVERVYTLAA